MIRYSDESRLTIMRRSLSHILVSTSKDDTLWVLENIDRYEIAYHNDNDPCHYRAKYEGNYPLAVGV